MDIVTEIQNDQLYDSVRLSLRRKESKNNIIQELTKQGLTDLQAESIVNTSRLIKKASFNSAKFVAIVCTIIAITGILAFSQIPHGTGAGFINYSLFSIMVVTPLIISYVVNHGIITLEFKQVRNKMYFGFIAYLVIMISYLVYYKFSQNRHIWEALLFLFIAVDFKNLFEASDDTKFENPQYHLEIKAYQGEQQKYKVFKRITFTSSLILVYMMLISSHAALAGLSFIPFGVIVISIYWVIMSIIEMNFYKKIF